MNPTTSQIYTLSLHDALPISLALASLPRYLQPEDVERLIASCDRASAVGRRDRTILLLLARRTWPGARSGSQSDTRRNCEDRKSTRLNSSHVEISYAVFCLKK